MNAYLSRSLLAGSLLTSFAFCQSEATPPKPTVTKPEFNPDNANLTPGLSGLQQRPASKEALFRAFAAIKGLSADYTEEKFLSLLAVPLKSAGKLHFMQPGYLSRIVESPEKSKLTITESELRMASTDTTGKNKEEVIDLRQSDRVRLFVTSLVQVFQGDGKALKQHYQVRYTPKADDFHVWQLELKPRKSPLTQIMKRLVLVGRDQSVTRIELHEPNGDRTITKIVKVNPKRVFTAKEQKEIFGVTAKPTPSKTPSSKPPSKKPDSKKPSKTNKAGAPR